MRPRRRRHSLLLPKRQHRERRVRRGRLRRDLAGPGVRVVRPLSRCPTQGVAEQWGGGDAAPASIQRPHDPTAYSPPQTALSAHAWKRRKQRSALISAPHSSSLCVSPIAKIDQRKVRLSLTKSDKRSILYEHRNNSLSGVSLPVDPIPFGSACLAACVSQQRNVSS